MALNAKMKKRYDGYECHTEDTTLNAKMKT